MRNTIILFIACVSFFACASEDYQKNVQRIIAFELDEKLNKLSAKHVKCYICEIGEYPKAVPQIIKLKPESPECKSLFTKEFSFLDPAISSYQITTKEWDDRVTFVFTKDGAMYDELNSTWGDTSITMNIQHSELDCRLKN